MSQELPEGTVTVLFTDLVGSTDLATRRGDEAAQEILRAQRDVTREQLAKHSGHEVKSTGDGFMVAFASARKAVACAVEIQRGLEKHNRRQAPDEQFALRMGLNTGEAIQEEGDLYGAAVNAAARICAKAKGGQLLVSQLVKDLVGLDTDVPFVDCGRFRLKGFPERWRLFEVIWQEEAAATPALLERTPFVGREKERAELRRCVEQAANGQGALVLIGGEPGVGKTRLAEEVALDARERGLLTLTGHCYEMEGSPPYIPFVEIVEASARLVAPEALRDALGESAPEVAKLMPELRRRYPDIPSPPELPPEQERRYLFNGMRDFLTSAGRVQPMLLVLEDLHWGDDSTLLLLQHIAQGLHEMAVIVVGTYRDAELDVARPLARGLEGLVRQHLAQRISLKRLPEAGVGAMMRVLSGQEPPQPLVDVVYGETEGNPFFVEEVFHHLAEEGKLFDARGRWRVDLDVSELDVPEGVRLVIGRRLERVCEECRRALTTAAVIGRAFRFELLEAVSDIETDFLLDALDEAERARLVASTSRGTEDRFTFGHELIRQTLLGDISAARRQRLHLRLASAMERIYCRDLAEHVGDLAHHLHQAGAIADPKKTVEYMTLAGEHSMEAAAFEDALHYYESALSVQSVDDRQGRADLLFKRGLALLSLGRWEQALTDWREALTTYEGLADAEAIGRICAEMTVQMIYGTRFVEAFEISRRGLDVLGEQVSAARGHLIAAGGISLSAAGAYAAADAMLTQALTMGEELCDDRLLAEARGYRVFHHWAHMEHREVVSAAARGQEPIRAAGGPWRLADTLWLSQWALVFLGRLEEAAKIGGELEPLAVHLGHMSALLCVRRNRAHQELMTTADIDEFKAFARGDLEICRGSDLPWASGAYTYLGLADFWRGRWQEALKNFEEAARLEPPGFVAGADWAFLFLCKAYIGDKESALAMLEQKRDNVPRPGQPNTFGAWTMLLAVVEGLCVLDEREDAASFYHVVQEVLDTGALMAWPNARLLQSVIGMAAAAGHQWDAAEGHFETALRQAHEVPVVIEQPEVRRWYARMLIDRDGPGDRDKAFRLLSEAIAMYRQIGMPKHVEMAETLLAEV